MTTKDFVNFKMQRWPQRGTGLAFAHCGQAQARSCARSARLQLARLLAACLILLLLYAITGNSSEGGDSTYVFSETNLGMPDDSD